MLKTMSAKIQRIADGKYLVTVFACDTGTGKEKASYDNLGKVITGDVDAMKLMSQEINTAGGRVANLNMPLPFRKQEDKETPAAKPAKKTKKG